MIAPEGLRRSATPAAPLLLALLVGCGASPGDRLGGVARDTTEFVTCSAPRRVAGLPGVLKESSGLALSEADPDLVWSHDDSGAPPELIALDTLGNVRARVLVRDARNVDWEDLAAGPCPSGGRCLYIADTGNNHGDRRDVTIYRVAEPSIADAASASATPLLIRYPGGPYDTEAMAVAPSGAIYLVTKGSLGGPRLVLLVARATANGVNIPVPIARLGGARPLVTGAGLSPDGRWLAIRTYQAVRFFRVAAPDSLLPVGDDAGISLAGLREPQGEAVTIRGDGTVFLSSEARHGRPGQLSRMGCILPR